MTRLNSNFSNYIIYVDESGDHGLNNLDPNYPIFVLVFVIFKIEDYIKTIVPSIQKFKFKHFGHDQSIFHETDIRKDRGDFVFLKSKVMKKTFIDELTQEVANAPLYNNLLSDKKKYL